MSLGTNSSWLSLFYSSLTIPQISPSLQSLGKHMDPTDDLGRGHEIQAVWAEVGKHIPEETKLSPGVFAALQPTLQSQPRALQVAGVTCPGAQGQQVSDVWAVTLWCFPLELELSSHLMTATGTLCSAGHPAGKIHCKASCCSQPSAGGQAEALHRGPQSNVKSTVSSSAIRRKALGKSNPALNLFWVTEQPPSIWLLVSADFFILF